MAGCEYFDALSYEAELGFQRWEEELEQVIGIIRHCIDTADTFHTIKFVKSSKLLAIFSLFTELEDKLWFTQTLQLEKQWRLLREKTDNLKEQAEKLQATRVAHGNVQSSYSLRIFDLFRLYISLVFSRCRHFREQRSS
ncbi:hypothetical protein Gasu2_60760 [Galdieria sulphuraria]|nr:hypothetical protein Gasu2_60760 [Galdieria sulphuraria]